MRAQLRQARTRSSARMQEPSTARLAARDRSSGMILSFRSPRAQGGDKRGLLLPVITSGSECLGSKCYPALPKLQLHAAPERRSERGSTFWLPARPVCRAASYHTRPEIRIHLIAGRRLGIQSAPPANARAVLPGTDHRRVLRGRRNRSAFPGACDEANVRYCPLIGHSGKAARGRETA